MNFDRQVIKAPDKGSFPLDHFHDCETEASKYNKCLVKHKLLPKRCRKFQIGYLECRMKNGLMEKTTMENLGLADNQTDWKSEKHERDETFDRISQIKQRAYGKAMKERWRKEQHNMPQDFPKDLLE